jgi:hypothetical protein
MLVWRRFGGAAQKMAFCVCCLSPKWCGVGESSGIKDGSGLSLRHGVGISFNRELGVPMAKPRRTSELSKRKSACSIIRRRAPAAFVTAALNKGSVLAQFSFLSDCLMSRHSQPSVWSRLHKQCRSAFAFLTVGFRPISPPTFWMRIRAPTRNTAGSPSHMPRSPHLTTAFSGSLLQQFKSTHILGA